MKFMELGYSLNDQSRNFGDLLLRESAGAILDFKLVAKKYSGGSFGGSLLSQDWFKNFGNLRSDRQFLLYGCGVRSAERIDQLLPESVDLLGVRGNHSQVATGVNAIGDPGILAPLTLKLAPNVDRPGQFLLIPHKNDPSSYSPPGFMRMSPMLMRGTSSLEFSRLIAASDFVLTGSLHVGILAFALGTPFCFFKDEYLDVPIKFNDFADFYKLPITFASSADVGIEFFLENQNQWGDLGYSHFESLMNPLSGLLNLDGQMLLQKVQAYLVKREAAFNLKRLRLLV